MAQADAKCLPENQLIHTENQHENQHEEGQGMLTREAPSVTTNVARHHLGTDQRPLVSVCVWTNQPVVRAGLMAMLESPELSIDVEVGLLHHHADVVLLDVALLDSEPSAVEHWLAASTANVVAVDSLSRPELTALVRAAGIEWSITLRVTRSQLQDVVREAATGTLENHLVASRWTKESYAGETAGLSRREAEVLGLIAGGLPNQEIALHLAVSINSVKSYIRGAYRKIEVTSRSQAVAWAMRRGIGSSTLSAARA